MNQPYRCSYETCYKHYNTEKNLRRHIRAVHNEPQRFQCTYCRKQLASTQNLREHMYLHTGEMPYQCSVSGCGARFRQGSQLSAHRKTHSALSTPEGVFKELKVLGT